MCKFWYKSDKEERAPTYIYIYIYIYIFNVGFKKKISYITLEVIRDTHYEYFRCGECFGFFVNILWRHVFVSKRRKRWKFLFSGNWISKTQSQTLFGAKFIPYFCPIWTPNDVSFYYWMRNIQAMLNVRNLETVKLLLLAMKNQLKESCNRLYLRKWKCFKICHKILKYQETVKFSILKKDAVKKIKKKKHPVANI